MKLDRPFFIVLLDHQRGPYFSETDWWRTTREQIEIDLRHGQYNPVLAVIEVNPITQTCKDMTDEFEAAIVDGTVPER